MSYNAGGAYTRHGLVVDNKLDIHYDRLTRGANQYKCSYPTIRLTAKVLQGLNCAVTGLTNGRDALAYLADRNNPRPHLIFIKIKGLGYTPDGHEVAQILRTQAPFIQDPVLQSTPIIGLTAMGQLLPENLKFMNDMLHKPMKVRDIRWVFITWMRRDQWQPHPKI